MRSFIVILPYYSVLLASPGANTANVRSEDAGRVLADVVREYMQAMGIQNGITELGFSREDIPALVRGALPQVLRVVSANELCPCTEFTHASNLTHITPPPHTHTNAPTISHT